MSGGMDSVTLAWHLHESYDDLHLVSFNYGQRHARELRCAAVAAIATGADHSIIELPDMRKLLHGSALTDLPLAVPDGHYAEESMKVTVVPNRNMMMLAMAGAIAVAEDAELVAIGVHGGDHFIYPDCRPEFIAAASAALLIGNVGFTAPQFEGIVAPFLHFTKAEIVSIGDELGVPWEDTWSCYRGEELHCGRCGTCVERQEAFMIARVDDPTEYVDPEFWKTAAP